MRPKGGRVRADQRLVSQGLATSRAEAQAMIMAGDVFAGEARIDKAGTLVADDAIIRVTARRRFVSRGGDKLDHALSTFAEQGLVIASRVCLDIGASTGGFTDCLLHRGAAKVFAVDVGYGQLAEKLRVDPRVVVRERENARDLNRDSLGELVDLVVVDASFIGLGKLVPAIVRCLAPGGDVGRSTPSLPTTKPIFSRSANGNGPSTGRAYWYSSSGSG